MKKFWVSLTSLLLAAMLLTPAASAASYTPPFTLGAQAAYLVNLDSNMMIYEKKPDTPIQPGGLAQLMTLVLAIERVEDPAGTTVEYRGYIQDEMYRRGLELGGIRLAGLYKGDTLSVEQLMMAVMLPGANEAAMILADGIGDGSVPYFVELMNQRAAELGMTNTTFTSPHGLPDENAVTTARDMAILAQHAMSLPAFEKMCSVTSHYGGTNGRGEALNWNTANKLILKGSDHFNGTITGVQESWCAPLGSSAISLAKKDGYSYMLVVMGSTGEDGESRNAAFSDTNRLLDWAFDTFRVKTLLEKGKSFGEVPLRLCWGKDFLRVMSVDSFTALIPDDIEVSSVEFRRTLPEAVDAPIERGTLIGEVTLVLLGEEIGRVGIVSAESVEASRALLLIEKLVSITRTFWFKFIVVFLVLLVLLYIVLMITRNRSRRRYRTRD